MTQRHFDLFAFHREDGNGRLHFEARLQHDKFLIKNYVNTVEHCICPYVISFNWGQNGAE